MYSNASTAPSLARCSRSRSRSAAGRSTAAASAVAWWRGFGDRRSTAAVMRPKVPSAPMNRSRRSRPELSLCSAVIRSSTRPSASTTSSPGTSPGSSRIAPRSIRRHWSTDAADPRRSARAEGQREGEVVRLGGRMEVRKDHARLDHRDLGLGADLADGGHAFHRHHERALVGRPADQAGVPPHRDHGEPMPAGEPHHLDDLRRRGGRTTATGVAGHLPVQSRPNRSASGPIRTWAGPSRPRSASSGSR